MKKLCGAALLTLALSSCGSDTTTTGSANPAPPGKSAGARPVISATSTQGAATGTSAANTTSSGAPSEDRTACPKDNKPPTYEYADVKFEWSETPSVEAAPKDKAYANIGDKTFVLPKVEVWVSEKEGTVTLRTQDGVLLGPSLILKGEAKVGAVFDEKWGKNRGYFQVPDEGFTAACSKHTTAFNGENARVLKLTKYDGITADGSFATTWRENMGAKRKMWAAGTFKDAKVVLFKK